MGSTKIQTNETLKFISENIPPQKLRILEIGCGRGELARQLRLLNHEIIAIDSSPEVITQAKSLNIDARTANFPDFEESPFDVILFTRSLHHIRPLQPTVEKARELLKPSGLLLIEDFAYGDTGEFAAKWFYQLLKLLESCGVLSDGKNLFGRKLLAGDGDISLWREHDHEINSSPEIYQALEKQFDVLQAGNAPYLYRYISEMVNDNEHGLQIVADVLELEKIIGEESEQFLIGRRYVARPKIN